MRPSCSFGIEFISSAATLGPPTDLPSVCVVLLASLNGFAPQVCVEFGRKVLFSTERPNFRELEDDIRARKGK